MATRKANRWIVWVMVGLIAAGFGGWFTGGVGGGQARSLGTVGGLDVPIQTYANAVRSQIRRLSEQSGQPLTFAQAQALGIDRQVLAQIVTQRVLDAEARRLGISVGDDRVAQQIVTSTSFQGVDGQFDREVYREALRRNGLTEETFEAGLREDRTRAILEAAVMGGVPPATAYGTALSAYSNERRTVTWAPVGEDAVTVRPQPTDEQLRQFYDANPGSFSAPEVRQVSYAWLTPEMIQGQITVDDAAVKQLYDERIDQFVQPERRLVERLVYPSAEAAQAAKAQLDAGTATFEQLVEARGLQLSDTDMGDVGQAELGAAGEAVFGAATGTVVGPLDTDLGPALFRVNAVLAAQETTLEQATPDLRAELANGQARQRIGEIEPQLEDLLAGGAAVSDIADRTDLEPGTIAWSEGVTEGPAAYEPFRTAVAAAEAQAEPQVVELGDGGVAVIQVTGITPPALKPYEEVQADVRAQWEAQALTEAVKARGDEMATAIAGGAGFEAQGLTPRTGDRLSRRDAVEGTSPDFIATAFALRPGEAKAIPTDAGAIVVRLDSVEPAQADDPSVASETSAIAGQVSQSVAQDLFDAYARQLQSGTEVVIDDRTVAAVNAQIN